jgi:hypothetical protein
MHKFKEKHDIQKATSSSVVDCKRAASVEWGGEGRSQSCSISLAPAPHTPGSSKSKDPAKVPSVGMTNTQFANEFIATIHLLYEEVSSLTLPTATVKYRKITEKVQQDAAVFFQSYAQENIEQERVLLECEMETHPVEGAEVEEQRDLVQKSLPQSPNSVSIETLDKGRRLSLIARVQASDPSLKRNGTEVILFEPCVMLSLTLNTIQRLHCESAFFNEAQR